jgi:ABC-type phosphate transport system auxiliary subunit
MNEKYLILCLMLLPTFWLFSDNQFTKKKSKLPSTSQLKTDCAYSCGDYLDVSAQLRQNIAQLDQLLLQKSRALVEGESDSFFTQSSKEDLKQFDANVQRIKNSIVALNTEIEKQLTYLKGLK